MSEKYTWTQIQELAQQFRDKLDAKFAPQQRRTEAIITAVTRDAAGRAIGATATIDGVSGQTVAIDHGARIAAGDSWLVRNSAGPTLPRWETERRLRAAAEVQAPDSLPELPAPTGLQALTGLYDYMPGVGWRAYVRVSWLGIGQQYGVMGYEIQYGTNNLATVALQTATDRHPTTLLDGSITNSQTSIPRDPDEAGYQDDFPSFGRIQIESEEIDYLTVTTGEGDSGTGTGSSNTLTDGTKTWTTNEWADYLLTDSGGSLFLIASNTATALTVTGTPASGAYTIKPCFSGCTRAAGGTAAAAHDDNTGVGCLSVGTTLSEVQAGVDYNVRVRAISSGSALSAWTAWVSITAASDTTAPDTPTGMGYTPLTVESVYLYWTASTSEDLWYYVVAYTWLSGGPPGGYTEVKTPYPYITLNWAQGQPLYWMVKAVDYIGNESSYCAEQTAYCVDLVYTELTNTGFEDGVVTPTGWTMASAGVVTTTWLSSGGYEDSKAIQVAITAGDGAATYYTALISDIMEIQQGVTYDPPGFASYLTATTSNVLAYTVYQYSDALGTPATVPYVRNTVTQRTGWALPYRCSIPAYSVAVGSDVTHIALAFEVSLDTTYNQTVILDLADFSPQPVIFGEGDHGALTGLADDDHTQYAEIANSETITGGWTFNTNVSAGAGVTFDGVDLDDHSARHDLGGADAITTSSNPGAAAAILATASDGGLELLRLGIGTDPDTDNAVKVVDNAWIGLGSGAGRISFDNQDIDEVNIIGANMGIGTATPATRVHIIDTAEQLRVGYDDGGYLSVTISDGGATSISTTTDAATGGLTLAPAGDVVLGPVGDDVLPDTGYTINLGAISNKYLTLHAAELWVETLVAQDTIATIGGRVLIGPTTQLTADLGDGVGDTTITVKHNQMANGDRVVLQANGKLEWMAITSSAGGGAGAYTYSVTRNLDGTGRNLWYAGDAVFNTGTTGDGFIDLYSLQGIHGSGAGPTIVGNRRYGTTYSNYRPCWAIGNLNGVYGYGSDTMGVALGEYSEASYVTIDSTNGIQFKNSADATVAQLAAGIWTLGNTSTEHVEISSTAIQINDGATTYAELTGGTFRVGEASSERLQWDGTDLEVYDGNNVQVMNFGAAGNWISSLLISESMGTMLFTATDGVALWGPASALTATSWTSSREQAATISGAFHTAQGRWAQTQGLVVEAGTTNYIKDPQFGNATLTTYWAQNSLPTFERSTTRSLFGDYSMHCVANASGDYARYSTTDIAASNSQAWSLSCYLWVVSGTVAVQLRDTTGTMTEVNVTASPEWQRVTLTDTTAASGVSNVYPRFYVSAAAEWYVDGVQMEQDSVCTTYADGTRGTGYAWSGTAHASTTTRTVTEVNLDSHVSLISQNNTLSFRILAQMPYDYNSVGWASATYNWLWSARGADSNNYVAVYYNPTTTVFWLYINGQSRATSAAQTFKAGAWMDIVATLDFSNDSYYLYINSTPSAEVTTALTAPVLTVWRLGSSYASTQHANAVIAEYAVFARVLTADEVGALYATNVPLVDTGAIARPGLYIYDGKFHLASALSGARIEIDETGLAGHDSSGTLQIELDATDGGLKAGAGNVTLDANGISITGGTASSNRLKFFYGTDEIAFLVGRQESAGALGYHRAELNVAGDTSSYNSKLVLQAEAEGSSEYAILTMFGMDGGSSFVTLNLDGTDVYGFYDTYMACNSIDLRVGSGLYVGATDTDPADNCIHIGGDGTNAGMTVGLTIDQGAADDNAITFKSSDVDHGMTGIAETDTYGHFQKADSAAGGLLITGLRDADSTNAFALYLTGVLGEAANTTKSTSGYGVIGMLASVKDGTSRTAVGADGNLVTISNHGTTTFIFDAEGSAHADVEWTTFDEHDDLALLEALEAGFDPVRAGFGEVLRENRNALQAAKVVNFYDPDGSRAMVNFTRLAMLHTGAIRQLGARLERYEQELVRLGVDPARLLS